MTIDDMKSIIKKHVEDSSDLKYIIALYSFSVSYPDKSRENETNGLHSAASNY